MSAKKTFQPNTFAANTFACGAFRGVGVTLAPVANFTGTPLAGLPWLAVTFTDSSSNTPSAWLWEKSDGSGWVNFTGTPTAQNPVESFALGTWSVRLTASNIGGSDTLARTDYVVVSGVLPTVAVSKQWVARQAPTTWRANPVSLVWRAGMSQLVDNVLTKQPGDALWRFAMALADLPQLRAGATVVASPTPTCTATPSGLTIAGVQVDAGSRSVSALFSGGTTGINYAVTFTCGLSTGETVERTGTLSVET